MADSDRPSPQLEIHSDDDWKARVKAEDAKLDAERTTQSHASAAPDQKPPDVDAAQLPPADFRTLVAMLSTQAMLALGVIPTAEGGPPDVQLPLARHFIDLLGVLEDKTRGNLSDPEHKMLEQTLHELRMAFLELSRAQ
jgi:hypothetical protein